MHKEIQQLDRRKADDQTHIMAFAHVRLLVRSLVCSTVCEHKHDGWKQQEQQTETHNAECMLMILCVVLVRYAHVLHISYVFSEYTNMSSNRIARVCCVPSNSRCQKSFVVTKSDSRAASKQTSDNRRHTHWTHCSHTRRRWFCWRFKCSIRRLSLTLLTTAPL